MRWESVLKTESPDLWADLDISAASNFFQIKKKKVFHFGLQGRWYISWMFETMFGKYNEHLNYFLNLSVSEKYNQILLNFCRRLQPSFCSKNLVLNLIYYLFLKSFLQTSHNKLFKVKYFPRMHFLILNY
jgi:hypothetical protein